MYKCKHVLRLGGVNSTCWSTHWWKHVDSLMVYWRKSTWVIHICHQYRKVELNHTLGGGQCTGVTEWRRKVLYNYNLYLCYTYGCECLSGEYYCADHENVVHGVCKDQECGPACKQCGDCRHLMVRTPSSVKVRVNCGFTDIARGVPRQRSGAWLAVESLSSAFPVHKNVTSPPSANFNLKSSPCVSKW